MAGLTGLWGSRSVSSNSELFGELPEQLVPEAPGQGTPRLRQPERYQPGWQIAAIDDLVARDHPVRAVWGFVQGLDLRALHDAVKAREGMPGQAPAAPELMMALWPWATVDGVGSARQLARLCEQHPAYRWLCGGVSTNHHTLSDFRVAHAALLDQLLAGGVAALVQEGLVALDALAQDGLRVRAAAGPARPPPRAAGKFAAAAKTRVARLRAELEADPAAGHRRQRAAQQRAAREREERVKVALDRMSELEVERARREKTNKAEVSRQKEPRASTTDAEARAMKMADGEFAGLQPADRFARRSGHRRGRHRYHRLRSRPARPNAGTLARRREAAVGLPGRCGLTKNDDIEWPTRAASSCGARRCAASRHRPLRDAPTTSRGCGLRRRMRASRQSALQERSKAECPNAARPARAQPVVGARQSQGPHRRPRSALAHNMLRAFALRSPPPRSPEPGRGYPHNN